MCPCFGSQAAGFPRNVNETIGWSFGASDKIPVEIRKTLDHKDTGRQGVVMVNKISSLRFPENSQEKIPPPGQP